MIKPKHQDNNVLPDDLNNLFLSSIKTIHTKLIVFGSIIEINGNLGNKTDSPNHILRNINNLNSQRDTNFQWQEILPIDLQMAVNRLNNSDSRDIYNMSNNILKTYPQSI